MQLIFLGPPGAGKGTQAQVLAKQWQIPHISTGDILRQAIGGKTSLGIQAQAHVEAGELVPDMLIMAMMRERFGQPDMKKGWLVDGFPRTVSQALAFDQLLQIMGQPYPKVLYFDVATETLVARMLQRGRQDDTEETIRKRLQVYKQETLPLIDFYQRRRCLCKIDGNHSVAEVTNQVEKSLQLLSVV